VDLRLALERGQRERVVAEHVDQPRLAAAPGVQQLACRDVEIEAGPAPATEVMRNVMYSTISFWLMLRSTTGCACCAGL